jgi:signal transduction histidine kinase
MPTRSGNPRTVRALPALAIAFLVGLVRRELHEGRALELENERLSAEVESTVRELRASRTRILASADEERRRIERDLHDGAQQRLVALRIQLRLMEELLEADPERVARKLHSLGDDVNDTIDSIRSLARGVYPSLLAERGLGEALTAAARYAPIATRVHADGVGRHSREVESAVYFCCLEALQNASKHARGGGSVTISLANEAGPTLGFEVRDDGAGFDPAKVCAGAGLTNMHDRLAAVGGELAINSTPGLGTVIAGLAPVDQVAPAGALLRRPRGTSGRCTPRPR